jgi:tRNA-guanine family transglycosylase
LKFSGPIILDSGGYQNAHRDPVKVLEIQSIFRPDFVIHMDVVGDSKRTIRNARITREHENCFSFTIYYAIQGQNIIEYKKCAEKLLKIGCKRFALGNLAYQAYLRRLKEIMEVIFAVKKVTRNNPIHLLGVSNPKLILQLKNLITSFDSSTGVRNATRLREVFAFDGNQIKYFRKFNNRPGEFHCDCPICKIFDIFENEYNYPKGTGDRRKIRFSRAIHNTYIIWKVVNMKNETNT